MNVIVCGGRNFNDQESLEDYLDQLHKEHRFHRVAHGKASGADYLAGQWARKRHLDIYEFPADWKRYGRSAGPIRNARMLSSFKPDAVVAFPGGSGTRDMTTKAFEAGVPIWRFKRNGN